MIPRAARAGYRNVAVDALRAVALIGIMMNHIFGAEMASLVWWDTHAIGFALLIGAGAAFAVPASGADRAKPVARAWLRASVLVAAGFFLESVPNGGVAVILVRLAVITALVAVIALARTGLLPWVAALLLATTPQLAWHLQTLHPELFSKAVGWSSATDPGAWMRMLWAPYHPALLWLGVAVIGLWVVRRFDLSRVRDLGIVAALGALLSGGAYAFSVFAWGRWGAPAGSDLKTLAVGDFATLTQDWRWLLGVGAYLPSTPSLVFSSGIVLIAMAAVSLLCLARPVALALKPLAIIGGMTLSAYFLHVLLEGRIALWTAAGQLPNGAEVPTGWANFGSQVAILFVFLWLWHLLPGRLGKGPLEWLSRLVANTIVR
ncbi:hypothetical protein SAMN05421595_0065 [Austwickia chelonae]|uniref:Heparan-alpha-glucosaminide N-acetyltransferase catalytic domain-containing protein n=1 Tax=Austwickia chelonae NBRC 105200 TaxID=1184607 RepID=K6VQ26_9MICO|nr:hypothetical protein [Austwickia chelonae]GAB78854.1 hypothetical protein AUCHE_17_00660 [Austwickia chelonae NBRC 105200]SEV85352.1 hypothetical protein SAMN05421595_0065 [Austwickia chelonae]